MSNLTHLNPADLFSSPAFSQGVLAEGRRIVQVGGQNGRNAAGELVEGGLGPQSEQAMRNVLAVLKEAGAGPEHVIRLGIYLVGDADPREGFAATADLWGSHKTTVTVLRVVGLGSPGTLVEIEATAVLP